VKIAYARGLGTYDVLLADRVLFTAAAIDGLTKAAQPGPETQEAEAPAKAEKAKEVAE
jgi:hypothetical protein